MTFGTHPLAHRLERGAQIPLSIKEMLMRSYLPHKNKDYLHSFTDTQDSISHSVQRYVEDGKQMSMFE